MFPVVDGVPRLLAKDNELFDRDEVTSTSSSVRSPWLQRIAQLLPQPAYRTGPDLWTLLRGHVDVAASRLLIVGLGDGGPGVAALRAEFAEVTATDVVPSPGVDYVCDVHALPFVDDSFDVVLIAAVLEHVLDPVAAVAEVTRVLRKGGVVAAETPFMQQVHMGAYDFTRFTELGHRWLFRSYREIARGTAAGPATGLAWSLIYLLVGATTSPRGAAVAKGIGRIAFSAVARLDRLVGKKPGASDGASVVFFVGANEKVPCITARDLVKSYRGAIR
ncbi:MAG: class I SAM-dependent methyltransferase [Deltaproteobacteria bacterium]|nr:class I SAM-dependent methyltransferase [Deltaproteobacteria bacterium]